MKSKWLIKDDGIHRRRWFKNSLKEIGEDATALDAAQ